MGTPTPDVKASCVEDPRCRLDKVTTHGYFPWVAKLTMAYRTLEAQAGPSRRHDRQIQTSRQSSTISSSRPGATRHHVRRLIEGRKVAEPYVEECKILKIPRLRSMQRAIIDNIAQNPEKDIFVIAATGSGKSLLYELPAILQPSEGKITVVFIPRISIIKQELVRLQDCGIAAEGRFKIQSTNAVQLLDEQNQRFARAILNPALLPKLLLVTPNQLEYTESNFQVILSGLCEKGLVRRFVFDEIHMLLNNYNTLSQLPNLRRKYPTIPITVLSASLSPTAVQNISAALNITDLPYMFPLDRPNLYYEVLAKISSGDHKERKAAEDANPKSEDEPTTKEKSQLGPVVRLAKLIYPCGSGLVFCRTKKGCERFAKLLREQGVGAEAFDSEQSSSEEGARTFTKWKRNDPAVQILVSTNTLSNGMHKPDIRFVVHTSIPTSGIDGYMQETGRAGRDGLSATCLLLYSFGDAFRVPQVTTHETTNILALLWLINSTNCRRRALLSYYGDKLFKYTAYNRRCCDVCDGMTDKRPSLDVTPIARRVLQFCENKPEVLKGRKDLSQQLYKRFNPEGKREPTYDMWEKLIQWLVIEQYLEIDRPGERGGGQIKLIRSHKMNNLLQGGGQQVHLPWCLRFNELNVREEGDGDFRLRWTEELVDLLNLPDDDSSKRDSSPDLGD